MPSRQRDTVEGPGLCLSGERFIAVYHVQGSHAEAAVRARDICVEQTVEYPEDLVRRQDIREQILGRIQALQALDAERHRAVIEFPMEVAGAELTQLLNVLFGNISLKPGIRLVDFELPGALLEMFRGPRFGRQGLRALLGRPEGPLLCTALKPMGLGPGELANLAHRFALGGIHLIKDDHGLADQVFSPFEERVQRCAEAVRRANEMTGYGCLYVPNITGPADQVAARAHLAKKAGAGGFLIAPGLIGLDAMRSIADDDHMAMPILSHPALQGSLTVDRRQGMSHGVLYGLINRLAGADAAIFPNYAGRFTFTPEECQDLVRGTHKPMGAIKPIFPVPAGGMTLDRVGDLLSFYGEDIILLIGGDLHRLGDDLVQSCAELIRRVSQARG